MATKKGKRIALLAAAVALVVLLWAAYAARDWVVEEYYLGKYRGHAAGHPRFSSEDEVKCFLNALDCFARRRSAKAAPLVVADLVADGKRSRGWDPEHDFDAIL